MKILSATLSKSHRQGKKWAVVLVWSSGRDAKHTTTVHFGADGYEDYTQHKDRVRWERYIARHKLSENWTATGVLTAGFWSRWLLWNHPSFETSLQLVERKIGVKITLV
jgi:hypothetical protein